MTMLERLRTEAGLSKTALARAAGVSDSYIHRLEQGLRRPTVPTAQRICRALSEALGREVSVEQVFGADSRRVA